jgi:hypothetical protein
MVIFCPALVSAQKILVVENVNSLKNIKYYAEENIMVKLTDYEGRIKDKILDLTDSTVMLEIMGEVEFDDILIIYRENWLVQTLRGFSLLAGIGYFGIDTFNRFINHEYPTVDTGTLAISSGLVTFSFALTPFRYRKINTKGSWHLRMIDMNAF